MNKFLRWGKYLSYSLLAAAFLISNTFAQTNPIVTSIVYLDDEAFPEVKAYLSLSDLQGFPITGLPSEAFRASEDNILIRDLTVTPVRNEDQPLAVVIAIDTSGSVEGQPLQNSIGAAKNFVNTLEPEDKLALITFASEVVTYSGLTDDHASIIRALDTLEATGNTTLYDAIGVSIDLLKNRPERKVIVLLTDGNDSGISTLTFDDCINAANNWSTPIYPIGYGGVDKNILERLANLTGGFAQVQPDSNSLSEAFLNVLNNLREQYLVQFTSSFPADGLEHDLNITADYEGTSLNASQKFIAKSGLITVGLPEVPENSSVYGNFLFQPYIISPAPIQSLEISMDGQPLALINSAPFEYTWNVDSLSYGDHILKLVATDSAGNTGTLEQNIKSVPVITPSLSEGEVVGGKITLSTLAEVQAGIQKVEYFVDNQLIGESTTSPFELEWDTRSVNPGYHDIKTVATDLSGSATEATTHINVGIQKPSSMLWIALIILLAASAVLIPVAFRRNKRIKNESKSILETSIPQAQTTGASLFENNGLNPGQVWAFANNEIRLGRRSMDNDIPLMGLKASRYQGVIRSELDGFVLESISIENPMLLNGLPVNEPTPLQNGDIIEAGDSSFTFELKA